MAKSKPHTVRLDEEHLEYAMGHFGVGSVQKIVDRLLLELWERKENHSVDATEMIPEPNIEPDKPLEYYLEEYERVYNNKKCPKYISLGVWTKMRESKLAELKREINRLNGIVNN